MIIQKLEAAKAAGLLIGATESNIKKWLNFNGLPSWAKNAIEELINQEAWNELNNRFYKTLEFGTGGMRSQTIGAITPKSEQGTPTAHGAPEHPGVGTAYLNDFNLLQATIGLFRYCQAHLQNKEAPKLVIAHDVRHYSRHFCELAASAWHACGGSAFIFDGPRSTPELSFSVRYLKATAGVVISASHNPPTDNGFKVYFEDGAQVVPPHADNIINHVNQVELEELPPFFEKNLAHVITLPAAIDTAYQEAVAESIIDKEVFKKRKIEVVFSPIHGTGAVASLPILKSFGIQVATVPEQILMDPRFPTVKSPNPENPEALELGVKLAKEKNIGLVIGTDPDADRMGIAAIDNHGNYLYLTGNQVGALLLEYRILKFRQMRIIEGGENSSCALIKTFVTSPMLEVIAKSHGLKVINTLTGFKWIGEKLHDYELQLKKALFEDKGLALDYDNTSHETRQQLLLEYSTFFVFGAEESYGYLASDRVRDKDANSAALQICELYAYLSKNNKTIPSFLDELYVLYGYFTETLLNVYYEGAAGVQKINNILKSYRNNPPKKIGNFKVSEFIDFSKDTVMDLDGKQIPHQDFYFITLEDGLSYAVRASGTEPKIKFYIFAQSDVSSSSELPKIKDVVQKKIQSLKTAIKTDAESKVE